MFARTRIFRAREARLEKITSEVQKAKLFEQMLRLSARDVCQYFDQNHKYEFTRAPLNYYERQKIIYELRIHNHDSIGLDNCKVINIGNINVSKYRTNMCMDWNPINISSIYKLKLLKRLQFEHIYNKKLSCKIIKLPHLIELALIYGPITSLPFEIDGLRSLETLIITYTTLQTFPLEICRLTSLNCLRINHSNITNIPSEICQLSLLNELYLNNNRITQISSEVFQLTSLKALDLRNNQLTKISSEIYNLKLLKELYLQNNQLPNLPIEIFQLPALWFINAGNNPLDYNTTIEYNRFISKKKSNEINLRLVLDVL